MLFALSMIGTILTIWCIRLDRKIKRTNERFFAASREWLDSWNYVNRQRDRDRELISGLLKTVYGWKEE